MPKPDSSPGEKIRERRERSSLTQGELARLVGTRQQTIDKIERGIIKHSRCLPKIAQALNLSLPEIDPTFSNGVETPLAVPSNPYVGDRTLPVYGAVEGGDGVLVVSSEPVDYVRRPAPLAEVKDGYGFIIVGDSMAPELKPGETGLVHPHLPPVTGEPCVFYADDGQGAMRATVKSFVRQTATHWHVEQWNPPRKFSLARKEWQKCHRVVGKYSRR